MLTLNYTLRKAFDLTFLIKKQIELLLDYLQQIKTNINRSIQLSPTIIEPTEPNGCYLSATLFKISALISPLTCTHVSELTSAIRINMCIVYASHPHVYERATRNTLICLRDSSTQFCLHMFLSFFFPLCFSLFSLSFGFFSQKQQS